jgi:hypothetical protein
LSPLSRVESSGVQSLDVETTAHTLTMGPTSDSAALSIV